MLFFRFCFIVFARTISQPVIRLKNASVKVGEGDFNTRVDITGKDEIGALAESFNSMTLKLKSTTDELHEREERLRHFYEATVDGIILYEDKKALLVNHALSVLTGFAEDELMGKEIGEIITNVSEKVEITDYLNINAYEATCISKSGKTFPVEVQQGYVDYKGRKIHATVLRDISIRKEVETALKESLLEVQEMFNTTIDEVRKISDNLMPSILKEFGLETALRNLCKMMSHASNINIRFESLPLNKKPEERISTYLYRISQEALNNIVKHSYCSKAEIEIIKSVNNLIVNISDDGIGVSTSQLGHKDKTFGIYNITERVKSLNGKIKIESEPNKGFNYHIEIPI